MDLHLPVVNKVTTYFNDKHSKAYLDEIKKKKMFHFVRAMKK